ncbi:hypothetical protein MLD38_026877 [Melastoma candidum]|uniref:Uncharacterized protein n=1 Tax=Melastoma candidum TaxID=119954 RepID=A0ACB9P696_9MYRT|nr:hypothetical protein MLD38_026877 [Melastoma candidum]
MLRPGRGGGGGGRLPIRRPHQHQPNRWFVDAKVKWVPDYHLDNVVRRDYLLPQVVSLKNRIVSSASSSLPLPAASLLKPMLNLPSPILSFCRDYISLFKIFQPCPRSHLHIGITPRFVGLHRQELEIFNDRGYRDDAVARLARLLMLTRKCRLPIKIVDQFKWDLGLPYDYVKELLSDYPDYFDVSCSGNDLFLETVSFRKDLAVSELQQRAREIGSRESRIRYDMNFPSGYVLRKDVAEWLERWQELPYVSPYEDAFHLTPSGDQTEKWMVAVLHEVLWLTVGKKTEEENLVVLLADCLGFGDGRRVRKVLKRHPGIFYLSNKNATRTVVLREAYRKDWLLVRNPVVGIRHRYIALMNRKVRRRFRIAVARSKNTENPGGNRHGDDQVVKMKA